MQEESYSTTEVARLLSVHPKTVLYWCNNGKIDAYRTSDGGHWRITKTAIIRHARENNIPVSLS